MQVETTIKLFNAILVKYKNVCQTDEGAIIKPVARSMIQFAMTEMWEYANQVTNLKIYDTLDDADLPKKAEFFEWFAHLARGQLIENKLSLIVKVINMCCATYNIDAGQLIKILVVEKLQAGEWVNWVIHNDIDKAVISEEYHCDVLEYIIHKLIPTNLHTEHIVFFTKNNQTAILAIGNIIIDWFASRYKKIRSGAGSTPHILTLREYILTATAGLNSDQRDYMNKLQQQLDTYESFGDCITHLVKKGAKYGFDILNWICGCGIKRCSDCYHLHLTNNNASKHTPALWIKLLTKVLTRYNYRLHLEGVNHCYMGEGKNLIDIGTILTAYTKSIKSKAVGQVHRTEDGFGDVWPRVNETHLTVTTGHKEYDLRLPIDVFDPSIHTLLQLENASGPLPAVLNGNCELTESNWKAYCRLTLLTSRPHNQVRYCKDVPYSYIPADATVHKDGIYYSCEENTVMYMHISWTRSLYHLIALCMPVSIKQCEILVLNGPAGSGKTTDIAYCDDDIKLTMVMPKIRESSANNANDFMVHMVKLLNTTKWEKGVSGMGVENHSRLIIDEHEVYGSLYVNQFVACLGFTKVIKIGDKRQQFNKTFPDILGNLQVTKTFHNLIEKEVQPGTVKRYGKDIAELIKTILNYDNNVGNTESTVYVNGLSLSGQKMHTVQPVIDLSLNRNGKHDWVLNHQGLTHTSVNLHCQLIDLNYNSVTPYELYVGLTRARHHLNIICEGLTRAEIINCLAIIGSTDKTECMLYFGADDFTKYNITSVNKFRLYATLTAIELPCKVMDLITHLIHISTHFSIMSILVIINLLGKVLCSSRLQQTHEGQLSSKYVRKNKQFMILPRLDLTTLQKLTKIDGISQLVGWFNEFSFKKIALRNTTTHELTPIEPMRNKRNVFMQHTKLFINAVIPSLGLQKVFSTIFCNDLLEACIHGTSVYQSTKFKKIDKKWWPILRVLREAMLLTDALSNKSVDALTERIRVALNEY